ncbi:hypothetical protein N9272_01485 [bacterium]|nr:hypothetical protein [bacterium]MDB4443648.1 hypothetical protein [Saprospiraceae bacterium]MDC3219486.1 hypothetical protein [Saprospiraceae bacterium]
MKNHWINILKYNLWANQATVDLLNQYDEDIITRSVINSFPSIELTMKHIWIAEKIWLTRLKGKSDIILPEFKGTIKETFQIGMKISEAFLKFIENKDELFFNSRCEFQDTKGDNYSLPTKQIIHHIMNHSTYHRGQITTLGRQADFGEIKSTDYIEFATKIGH